MSVVGIDLGAQSTKIGVARNKGIDIVRIAPRPNAGSRFSVQMNRDLMYST
jgi:heat shock protein 4